tara:strand:+ start:201 stop:806 length:606 start_codon:yes stop_codon:yes gene_type:complete
MKKAAMFGLDARIALAIFGALSVISGAALYSAIKQAKVTAAVTEMNELIKAIESYGLDTGQLMPIVAHSILNANELVTSTVSGWNGPYIAGDIVNHGSFCSNCALRQQKYDYHPTNDSLMVIQGYKDNQSSSNVWKFDSCTSGPGCTVWVGLSYQSQSFTKEIDEEIDGTYNVGQGKVRISNWPGDIYHINYDTGIPIDQF